MYVKLDWQESVEALQQRYRAEANPHVRTRLHALWLLRQRHHIIAEIAALVGVNPCSVKLWIKWSRQGGLAEVTAHPLGQAGGAVPRLSREQQEQLIATAAQGVFHSIGAVRDWILEHVAIPYTYWGTRSLLDRLQIHAKVPRPYNPKADPQQQAAFKQGA